MFKIFIMALLFSSSLLAYNAGDRIDKSVINQLALKKDKVYIINFFASWCSSYKKELPLINTLSKKYNIIGINIDKELQKGESFVTKMNLKFKVIYDSDNAIVGKFKPVGVPAIYFVKDGTILAEKFGAIDKIDEFIALTLKEIK